MKLDRIFMIILNIFLVLTFCNQYLNRSWCNFRKEKEKEDVKLTVKIIYSLCNPQKRPVPNMILKFSFAPNFKDNLFLPNKLFLSSILIENTILLLLYLELTKDSWSKINNNKSWITINKLEILLKNTINLYFIPYLGFSKTKF